MREPTQINRRFDAILACYRSGQMSEAQWQSHLALDAGLSAWLNASHVVNPFDAERDRLIELRTHRFISEADYRAEMRAVDAAERKASR